MVVSKKVAMLGFTRLIVWEDKDGRQHRTTWPSPRTGNSRPSSALCSNAKGSAIYLLPWFDNVKTANFPEGANKEKSLFSKWSEFTANDAYNIRIAQDTLFLVGRILQLDYDSDKWTGYLTSYTHDFKNPPKLYNDKAHNPRAWGILDERGKKLISRRGVVG